MHFTLNVARYPVYTSPLSELLHVFMVTSRCCCNSASAFLIWGGMGGVGSDWVKWTVTTIWFAFTWSSCFPYFPFVRSPGSSLVRGEWCDAAQKYSVFNYTHYHYCYPQRQHQQLISFPLFFCQIEFELQTKKKIWTEDSQHATR